MFTGTVVLQNWPNLCMINAMTVMQTNGFPEHGNLLSNRGKLAPCANTANILEADLFV